MICKLVAVWVIYVNDDDDYKYDLFSFIAFAIFGRL